MWQWLVIGWVLSGMICLYVDHVMLYWTRTHPIAKLFEDKSSPWAAWVTSVIINIVLGPLPFIGIINRTIRRSRHFAEFHQEVTEAEENGERHPDEPTLACDPNCIACAVTFMDDAWIDEPAWAIASQSAMAPLVAMCLDGHEEIRRTLCEFHTKVLTLALDRNHAERDAGPAVFDCGCSRLKVRAGLCDVYGTDGKPIVNRPKEKETIS